MALFPFVDVGIQNNPEFTTFSMYENNFSLGMLFIRNVTTNPTPQPAPIPPLIIPHAFNWISIPLNQNEILLKEIVVSRHSFIVFGDSVTGGNLLFAKTTDAVFNITDEIFVGVGAQDFRNLAITTNQFTEFFSNRNYLYYKYHVSTAGGVVQSQPTAKLSLKTRPNFLNFMVLSLNRNIGDITAWVLNIETIYTPMFTNNAVFLSTSDIYTVHVNGLTNPSYVKKDEFQQGIPDEVIEARKLSKKRRDFIPESIRRRLSTRKKG